MLKKVHRLDRVNGRLDSHSERLEDQGQRVGILFALTRTSAAIWIFDLKIMIFGNPNDGNIVQPTLFPEVRSIFRCRYKPRPKRTAERTIAPNTANVTIASKTGLLFFISNAPFFRLC